MPSEAQDRDRPGRGSRRCGRTGWPLGGAILGPQRWRLSAARQREGRNSVYVAASASSAAPVRVVVVCPAWSGRGSPHRPRRLGRRPLAQAGLLKLTHYRPRCPMRPSSALVPTGEVDRVGLPGGDPGKHPLTAAGALRHRSAVMDLWAGLPSVHRKGQRDQPVNPTRRAKDLQSQASVPRTPTFHLSVAKPFAGPSRVTRRLSRQLASKCRLADRRHAACMALSPPCACVSQLPC